MSSCEPFLTTSYKQRVNELYISAEVWQRDISRGAVLHRWGVAYLQRGKCLCQHKQQPVLSRHERRALWSIPSDRRGMTAWACLESDRPLTERVWWCSCNHVSVRVPKIRTTAVVTYNILLNVTEVFLAPWMPNKEYYFLAWISASTHSEVFNLTERWEKKKNNFTEEIQFDQPVQAACSISTLAACCLAVASGFSWRLHSAVHCRTCFPSPPVKPSWTVYWGPPAEPKTFQLQHITESGGNVRLKYPLQRYIHCYSYKAAIYSHARGV